MDDKQLYHQINGSRKLIETTHEQVAQILSDPLTAADVCSILKLTPEQIAAMHECPVFKRRLAYLTKKKNRPKVKSPGSLDDYRNSALKRLHWLSRKAKNAKDQVSACKGIIEASIQLEKKSVDLPKGDTSSKLDDLAKAFGGGSGSDA